MLLNDGENGSQKVELVINQQDNNEYEISLINVFKNMGESSNLFIRIICLFLIVGMIASMGLSFINRDRGSAQATVKLTYQQLVEDEATEGSSEQKTYHLGGPDEMVFSSSIYGDAVKKANLEDLVSADSLSGNVVVQRFLTEESSQLLEVMQSAISSGKATSADLLGLELEYSDNYVVTIKNGFKKDPNAEAVYLSGGQLKTLLDSILDAYENHLYKTKANTVLPVKFLESNDIDKMDYIQGLTIIREGLNDLKNYCLSKAEEYPTYRSSESGLSFEELAKLIEISKSSGVDYLYSYVYSNNISKDPEDLITGINYEIRQKNSDLEGLDLVISSNKKIINEYKNEQILLAANKDKDYQKTVVNTDYYNSICAEQSELYKERAALQSEIDSLKTLAANYSDKAITKNIDDEVSVLVKKTEELEDFVYEYAKAFVSSDVIKASFANCSSAVYSQKSFINSGSIKSAVIAGVVGAFLAVCTWAVYAFVVEVKKEEKRHEAA